MHGHTACGQWAVKLVQCIATLPAGSGLWNSCNELPQCPGDSGLWKGCNALPHCLWAVGGGVAAMHGHTASGQRALELLQCTATLLGGSGQWKTCNALPHCVRAAGGGIAALQCHTA